MTESSIRLLTAIPGPRSIELMQRRDANLPRGVSTAIPVFVRRADGATVEDVDGNQFLDFVGGIGCQNAGHRPPKVVVAIREQVDQFTHTCFQITPYENYVELAEWLNAKAPGDSPKKTFFVNSGAEAIENAVKIARSYTRRLVIGAGCSSSLRARWPMSSVCWSHSWRPMLRWKKA